MSFIKVYVSTLFLCGIFLFCGGWMLFDFNERFFVATAACSFIIAVLAYVFIAQEEKIEDLEKRVKELEEKED